MKLQTLESGENARLKTSFYPNLIRTGTVGDGSCFFHAVLTSISAKYRQKSKSEKHNLVKKTRKKIAGDITIDDWKKFGDSYVALMPTFMNAQSYFKDVYEYLKKPDKLMGVDSKIKNILNKTLFKECLSHYTLISEILPLEDLERQVFPHANAECEKDINNVDNCLKILKKTCVSFFREKINIIGKEQITRKKIKYFINLFSDLTNVIINQALIEAFNEFKHKLSDCREWVDNFLIEFLSDFFNLDIYFIDGKTLLPYKLGPCNYKKRQSIVILWYSRTHYESISVINDKRQATRSFSFDHPFIQKLYTYLCEPEKLSEKYPELVEQMKEKINKSGDESEEDDEEESEEESEEEDDEEEDDEEEDDEEEDDEEEEEEEEDDEEEEEEEEEDDEEEEEEEEEEDDEEEEEEDDY